MPRTPSTADDDIFDLRLNRSAPDLWPMLDALYGQRDDYDAFKAMDAEIEQLFNDSADPYGEKL